LQLSPRAGERASPKTGEPRPTWRPGSRRPRQETKSPASGDAGSQEVGQAAGNARQPRHADEDGVSHVRDPEPLRRRACRAGAAAKRGRDPALAGAGWGSQADPSGGRRRGAAAVADHRGHPVHLGWPPPWHRWTGPRARPGCWSGPASDRSTPTIWPRWPSAAAWKSANGACPLTDGGIEALA
jgi:hypothetical protein